MSDSPNLSDTLCVLNQMPGSIAWSDLNSNFVLGNDQYVHLGGYKNLDTMVDTAPQDMPLEGCELADQWVLYDKIAIETKGPVKMVTYLELNGRADRCLMFGIKTPRHDNEGNIIGTCGQYIDITQSNIFSGISAITTQNIKTFGKTPTGAWVYRFEESFFNLEHKIQLTPRQSEVLFFLLRGRNAREIGALLFLSKRTIEIYVIQLKERLGCTSKSSLIERALELGFLQAIPERILNGKFAQD